MFAKKVRNQNNRGGAQRASLEGERPSRECRESVGLAFGNKIANG